MKLALLLVLTMMVSMMFGCSTEPTTDATEEGTTTDTMSSGEKANIKFYGKVIEYTSGPMMTDALEAKLAETHEIESIQVDWANLETVIRTGIASNEPADIYNCSDQQLGNFQDMAVDLTPYLEADPEFKAYFSESALESVTFDGKILGLPWETNFQTILGNKEAIEAAGVEIPEAWTMEEFMEACQKIQDAGKFPFANATDLNRAYWIFDNAYRSEVNAAGMQEEYTAGTLSYDSDPARAALESVKGLYDNGYMYPGEGAVTVKNDEVKAAFYQGDVLMFTEIAAGAKQTALAAEGFTPVPIPWPSSSEVDATNGVMNVLFIPQNSENIEAAVQVIKAYLAPDIQSIHAEEGYIPANVAVEITDTFVNGIVAQTATKFATPTYPSPVFDYLNNNMTADLVLNGGVETVVTNVTNIADMSH